LKDFISQRSQINDLALSVLSFLTPEEARRDGNDATKLLSGRMERQQNLCLGVLTQQQPCPSSVFGQVSVIPEAPGRLYNLPTKIVTAFPSGWLAVDGEAPLGEELSYLGVQPNGNLPEAFFGDLLQSSCCLLGAFPLDTYSPISFGQKVLCGPDHLLWLVAAQDLSRDA